MGFLSALGKIGKFAAPMVAGMVPGAGQFLRPMVQGAMNKIGQPKPGIGPSQMPGQQQQQPFMGPQQNSGMGGGFMQKLGGMFGGGQGGMRMPTGINGPIGQEGQNQRMGGWMQKLMQQMQQGQSAPPYIMNQQNPGINPRAQQGPQNMSVPQGRSMRMPNLTNSIEQGRREYNNPQMRQQPTMY